MKSVSLDYCDFPKDFCKTDNFFHNLLTKHFDLRLSDKPDFLIYSDFGHIHRLHKCIKIYYTGECWQPDFTVCDYALTPLYIDNARHLRLPFYVLTTNPRNLLKPPGNVETLLAQKTRFCSFVVGYADKTVRKRTNFFHLLSRYKKVDSGGRALNNIGGPIPPGPQAKIEFLRSYKFNIAFENSSIPGYTTEKLVEAMQARCLPVYWGNPLVHLDFNPLSFLNLQDFVNEEALVEKIVELDRDDARYIEYHNQPYFNPDHANIMLHPEKIVDFFDMIFSQKIRPVASRRRLFTFGRWILAKHNK